MSLAHDILLQTRTDDVVTTENAEFNTLFLDEKTLTGLQKSGFRKPSPIQQKAIPIGKCGFDLVIKSKSGTGKTAVFAIIALEMIDTSRNCIQSIIIAPTREIAVQIHGVIETIGSEYQGLNVQSFIGGMPLEDDIVHLQSCNIAVGAPGRLKHLIEAGALKTDAVKLLVLDEADKLMEPSFYDDINWIYYKLPKCFQMIAASATYPNNLDHYISAYMHTPTHITAVNTDTPLLLGLRQFAATVRQTGNVTLAKNKLLIQLLSRVDYTQCIVFSNYQTRAESVSNVLNTEGFESVYITAAQTQPERLEAMAKLKTFQCRVILSTDLTARGIDASNVDMVVNYDVPNDVCTYLHRMGRAGRYGSRGLCITLAENGKELETYKKLIGLLGGINLSIAKITNVEKVEANTLWNDDLDGFDQIYGTNPSSGNYTDIQKSLRDLKQYKIDNTVKSSNPSVKDITSKKINADKSRISISGNDKVYTYSKETLFQFRDSSFAKTDLETLRETANLNDNVALILTSRNDKVSVTDQASNSFAPGVNEKSDSNSKRKRVATSTSPINDSMPQEKRNSFDICQKNVALLNVTQLLCDESTDITEGLCGNISKLLTHLKSGPNELLNEQPISLCNTEEDDSKRLPVKEQWQEVSPNETKTLISNFKSVATPEKSTIGNAKTLQRLENLFEAAYKFAIDENESHWLTVTDSEFDEEAYDDSKEVYLSENLLDDFKNVDFEEMEQMYEDDDDDNLDNENIIEEDFTESHSADSSSANDALTSTFNFKRPHFAESINVKSAKAKDTNSVENLNTEAAKQVVKLLERHEKNQRKRLDSKNTSDSTSESCSSEYTTQFDDLFAHCNNNLLMKVQQCESHEALEDCFENWEKSTKVIREYVQEKSYRIEMKKNCG